MKYTNSHTMCTLIYFCSTWKPPSGVIMSASNATSVSVEVTLNMFLLLVGKRESNKQNRLLQRLCTYQQQFPDVSGSFRKVSHKPSFRTLGVA